MRLKKKELGNGISNDVVWQFVQSVGFSVTLCCNAMHKKEFFNDSNNNNFSSIHGNAFDGGFSDFTLQQINTRNERL